MQVAAAPVRTCWVRINERSTDYATVQAAVDAAQDGDVVKIAGYCTGIASRQGTKQMAYVGRNITLRGGYTTTWGAPDADVYPTTLDARGEGRVLYIDENVSTTIEGLGITGGDAAGLGGGPYLLDDAGGGVYADGATIMIRNSQVFRNAAQLGGGVYLVDATVEVTETRLFSNTAELGGGVYAAGATVGSSRSRFLRNSASLLGGGLYAYESSLALDSVDFGFNVAGIDGGGLYLDQGCTARIADCSIDANSALERDGGGLYMDRSSATVRNSVIRNNETAEDGGGFYLFKTSSTSIASSKIVDNRAADKGGGLYVRKAPAAIANTVLAGNSAADEGSALYLADSSVRLLHNTVVRNVGRTGIYVAGERGPSLTNTILAGHMIAIEIGEGSTAHLEGTLWGADAWANGHDWIDAGATVTVTQNVWGDPTFEDPVPEDYHLRLSSPAIDRGVEVPVGEDRDGSARPIGPAADIGADEAGTRVYVPLISRRETESLVKERSRKAWGE